MIIVVFAACISIIVLCRLHFGEIGENLYFGVKYNFVGACVSCFLAELWYYLRSFLVTREYKKIDDVFF